MHRKKNKFNLTVIMSWFILVLMIGSMVAVVSMMGGSSNDSLIKMNGFKIYKKFQDGYPYYELNEGENTHIFYYAPDSLVVDLPTDITQLLKNSAGIIVLVDPTQDETTLNFINMLAGDLAQFLLKINKQMGLGISEASESYNQTPVVSCNNATAAFPFISFEMGDERSINIVDENPNCIKMVATQTSDLLQYRDVIQYELLGVIGEE